MAEILQKQANAQIDNDIQICGTVSGVAFTQNQRDEVRILGDKVGALAAHSGSHQTNYILLCSEPPNEVVSGKPIVATLMASHGKKCYLGNQDSFSGDYFFNQPLYIYNEEMNSVSETDIRIRKLTPKECAKLQGFPENWASNLGVANPTEELIQQNQNIFSIYAATIGNAGKKKTEKQIRKWLANPHSDTAEYTMWGNGVALPCVYFIMEGIVWHAAQGNAEYNLEI
jgi:site-specific DNA-cytosine methylase